MFRYQSQLTAIPHPLPGTFLFLLDISCLTQVSITISNATALGIAMINILCYCQGKPLRPYRYASIGSAKRDPAGLTVATVCFFMKTQFHPLITYSLCQCVVVSLFNISDLTNASNSPEELQNPAEERGALQAQFKDADIRLFIFC